MPKNTEKELLKDRFGAYVKVSILHVRKKYMTKLENIVLHEIKLEEIDFIEDEEQMPEIALFPEGKFFDEKKMDAREILKYIENPVLYSAVSALKTENAMQTVYTDVAGIATVAAVVCAAVCLFLMNFSKSGRTVDESRSWLKRIVICWAALMTLGAIVTYLEKIIPQSMFTGG